jgi:hypothetical protein
MDTYDQILVCLRAIQDSQEELAIEQMSMEWVDNPSGKGSIERPYEIWAPSEKKRNMEIDDMQETLDRKMYHAQLSAEEHLNREQLACLIDAIGEDTWYCHRTQYMPGSEASAFLASTKYKNQLDN